MLKNHVAVEGDTLVLAFKGKGGKDIKRELRDPLLARVDFGLARLRPDVARPFFAAGFAALRVELFSAFRFGVDFFAPALAGARFLAEDVFAFVLRLVG